MRPDLAHEAMRLARMLAALAPDEPEVLGLQALLEIQGSRMAARIDEQGEPVLLEAQDRTRWDQLLIRRGLAALQQAERSPRAARRSASTSSRPRSPPSTPARPRAEDTGWRRIAALYDVLAERRAGTGRRGQPGGRARPGVRPRRGAGRAGPGGPRCARRLPAGAERARRPARTGRAPRAGERGVHPGSRAHTERERACGPAASGRARTWRDRPRIRTARSSSPLSTRPMIRLRGSGEARADRVEGYAAATRRCRCRCRCRATPRRRRCRTSAPRRAAAGPR